MMLVVKADCFHRSKPKSSYAIVGSPGTGKSWTLVYALQQALMYDVVCVMFALPKHRKSLVCIRKSDRVFVWEADTPGGETTIGRKGP